MPTGPLLQGIQRRTVHSSVFILELGGGACSRKLRLEIVDSTPLVLAERAVWAGQFVEVTSDSVASVQAPSIEEADREKGVEGSLGRIDCILGEGATPLTVAPCPDNQCPESNDKSNYRSFATERILDLLLETVESG